MANRVMSMHMNVRGFLQNSKFPKDYRRVFTHDDGRSATPEEARDFLLDQLEQGRRVIPLSSECGNPCRNAFKGCAGFDYAGKGCPGYLDAPAEAIQRQERHQPSQESQAIDAWERQTGLKAGY